MRFRINKCVPRYAGRALVPGERFEVTPRDEALFEKLGWLEPDLRRPSDAPAVNRSQGRRKRAAAARNASA